MRTVNESPSGLAMENIWRHSTGAARRALVFGVWRSHSLPFLFFGPLYSGHTPRHWDCSPFCTWSLPYQPPCPLWLRAVAVSGGIPMVGGSSCALFTDCPSSWFSGCWMGYEKMKNWYKAAPPNRRLRFAFAISCRFDYFICAPPPVSAAVGDPQRSAA